MKDQTTRRRVVRSAGLLSVGGLTALSGCSDAANDISNGGNTGSLSVTDKSSDTTAFGNVVVRAVVANSGENAKSGTLVGQVEIEGGDTYTKRRNITVQGGHSSGFELKFDIDFGESLSGAKYRYNAYME